jgi:pyruvate,water dikinase
VFFVPLASLRALARGETVDLRAEAAAGREAWHRWLDLVPPESLGAPLPPGLERMAPLRQQFGMGAPGPAADGTLRGFGASGGTVTARARIILNLDEGELLEPGEVLVCPNTAPPWTPLFAYAAAVVVEAGGPLSHAGIAAREYAIPAVVAVQGATRAIPNGALVTVDGTAGTVAIVSG